MYSGLLEIRPFLSFGIASIIHIAELWLCWTHSGKEVWPCALFWAPIPHDASVAKGSCLFWFYVQSLHLLLAPIRCYFSLLCTGFFVPKAFGSLTLRCHSFICTDRVFRPSRCLALKLATCWGASTLLEAAAINSSVSHCFSIFGCALWQPLPGALTPKFWYWKWCFLKAPLWFFSH